MKAWRNQILRGGLQLSERRRFNCVLHQLRAGKRVQCMCLTAKGNQCKNKAKVNSIYCGSHASCQQPKITFVNVQQFTQNISQWKNTHVVTFDNTIRTDHDTLVLVWIALQKIGNMIRATHDGEGNKWSRFITMNDSTHGLSNGKEVVQVQKQKTSQERKQISLSTYNILYSNASDVLSPWESEMMYKTNNKVKERDLYWNVRKPRLLANLKKDHQDLPDIILFQEMTPSMWSSLNLTQYDGIRSKKGCCQFGDGFTWVCWKKDKFNLRTEYHTTMCRWVGARLEFEGKDIIVSSVHLPSNPSSSTFSKGIRDIQKILASESCPIVIGGDFNVTYNPMAGFVNLSGDAPTFNNDSVYKLDWIVGKRFKSVSDVEVNPIQPNSKWTNHDEGSDHTNIRMNLRL